MYQRMGTLFLTLCVSHVAFASLQGVDCMDTIQPQTGQCYVNGNEQPVFWWSVELKNGDTVMTGSHVAGYAEKIMCDANTALVVRSEYMNGADIITRNDDGTWKSSSVKFGTYNADYCIQEFTQ